MHGMREVLGCALPWRAIVFLVVGAGIVLLPLQAASAAPPFDPNLIERLAALEEQLAAQQSTIDDQAAQIAALTAALETEAASRAQADDALQDQVDPLEAKLAPFSTVERTGGGYDVYLTEANLHLLNGLGATNGYPADPISIDPAYTQTNGLGNIIVGYNEVADTRWDAASQTWVPWSEADRAGSHNIILGTYNNYSSFSGLVAGRGNYISGPYASVSAGYKNTASGQYASVSGGTENTASGHCVSVSGGYSNTARGTYGSVSGGVGNTVSGDYCNSVSGGAHNTASGWYSSVSGGSGNTASGASASVTGGSGNAASGEYASVSGGRDNTADADSASVSGGLQNRAEHYCASVSGGIRNTASSVCASVSGGTENTAAGAYSSVSGGAQNTTSNQHASVSGGLQNTAGGHCSSVSGGQNNTASGWLASVSGGVHHEADGHYDWRAGGQFAALQDEVSVQATQLGALDAALGAETSAREAGDINTLTGAYAYTDTQIEAALGGFDPSEVAILRTDVDALQDQVDPLEAALAPFSTVERAGGGYDVYVTAANLHIQNGLGATNGYPFDPWTTDPAHTQTNGLGNLIVGYNEVSETRWDGPSHTWVPWSEADRCGSHNIILGTYNNYSSFSGLVAGRWNYVSGHYASVSGGVYNTASGEYASVSGGYGNQAIGGYASASGGIYNTAIGEYASVSGGWQNTADGDSASVSGGYDRSTAGTWDWAAGALFEDF